MPAVALPRPHVMPFVWNFLNTAAQPQPQGIEGKRLNTKAAEVLRQWGERAEFLIATIDESDVLPYAAVPPNRTFYAKTRYVFIGEGEPLPFDLEDE